MSTNMRAIRISAIAFPGMNALDMVGPLEVLARIPQSSISIVWKDKVPIRDMRGMTITPDSTFDETSVDDVLVVPGGSGQETLMNDEIVLEFIGRCARRARYTLSVCTGALLCGAAGLLQGRRATTHWSAFHLLGYFGAIPVNRRVVVDGRHVSAAGVTAGIDGALHLTSLLTDAQTAQVIELGMEYAPAPPFGSGSLATAAPEIVNAARQSVQPITHARLATARRIATRLGITRY
jgi:cyclohexyl-isocyanide hydratase